MPPPKSRILAVDHEDTNGKLWEGLLLETSRFAPKRYKNKKIIQIFFTKIFVKTPKVNHINKFVVAKKHNMELNFLDPKGVFE